MHFLRSTIDNWRSYSRRRRQHVLEGQGDLSFGSRKCFRVSSYFALKYDIIPTQLQLFGAFYPIVFSPFFQTGKGRVSNGVIWRYDRIHRLAILYLLWRTQFPIHCLCWQSMCIYFLILTLNLPVSVTDMSQSVSCISVFVPAVICVHVVCIPRLAIANFYGIDNSPPVVYQSYVRVYVCLVCECMRVYV